MERQLKNYASQTLTEGQRWALNAFNVLNGISLREPPSDNNEIWGREWDYFIKGFTAGADFEKSKLSKALLQSKYSK